MRQRFYVSAEENLWTILTGVCKKKNSANVVRRRGYLKYSIGSILLEMAKVNDDYLFIFVFQDARRRKGFSLHINE